MSSHGPRLQTQRRDGHGDLLDGLNLRDTAADEQTARTGIHFIHHMEDRLPVVVVNGHLNDGDVGEGGTVRRTVSAD